MPRIKSSYFWLKSPPICRSNPQSHNHISNVKSTSSYHLLVVHSALAICSVQITQCHILSELRFQVLPRTQPLIYFWYGASARAKRLSTISRPVFHGDIIAMSNSHSWENRSRSHLGWVRSVIGAFTSVFVFYIRRFVSTLKRLTLQNYAVFWNIWHLVNISGGADLSASNRNRIIVAESKLLD